MVAISQTTIAHRKALLIASGPAMLEKMARPLKESGLNVNACESFRDAQRLFDHQALVVIPLRDDALKEAADFIAWLRDHSKQASPYILGFGRCPEGQRKSLAAKMRLNDLVTLPFSETDVKERLVSYRKWCKQSEESSTGPQKPMPSNGEFSEVDFEKTGKVSLFAGSEERSNDDESPEEIYCRECPVGIAMFDKDLRYLLANPRWIQQFHLKDREIVGKSQFEIFSSLHSGWRRIYERCLGGETRRGRETINAPHGPVEMRWEVRPWRDRSGQIGGITIAFEEVWQKHEENAAVSVQPDNDRSFTTADLRAPAVIVDLRGRVTEANEGAQGFLANFESASQLFCDELAELRDGKRDDVSLTHFEQGCEGHFAWTNTVRRDEVGQPVSVLRVGVPVPKEAALFEEAAPGETPKALFNDEDLNELSELAWKASGKGEITFFNKAWLNYRGRALGSELNGGWLDGLHGDDARETKAVVAQAIREQQELTHEFRLKSDAGEYQTMIMSVRPYRENESGDVLGFVGMCQTVILEGITKVVASPQSLPSSELLADVAKVEDEIADLQAALAEAKIERAGSPTSKAFQASPALLFTCDARGVLQTINRQWERFRGRSLAEEEGAGWLEGIVVASERETVQRDLARAARDGLPFKTRFRFHDHACDARTVELQATPLLDAEGLSSGLSGTIRDISEEWQTLTSVGELVDIERTETLSPSELHQQLAAAIPAWRQRQGSLSADLTAFREIFDSVGTGIVLLGPEGESMFANKRHRDILGFGVEDAGDMESWLRRGCPNADHAEAVLKVWQNDIWQRQLTKVLTLTTAKGVLREIEVQPQLFLEDNRLLLTIVDITESKRSEEALRDSEIRFRALFRDSAMGIALIDAESKIYDINPALERVLDTPRRQLLCRDFDECLHADDQSRKRDVIEQLLASPKRSASIELRLARTLDSKEVWVRLNVSLVRDADQRVLFTAYFVQDITKQKNVQLELQVSQEQNRALLEAAPDLVMLVDQRGAVIDLLPSDSVPTQIEPAQAMGKPVESIIPAFAGKLPGLVQEAFDTDRAVSFSYTHDTPDSDGLKFKARLVACKPDNVVISIQPEVPAKPAPTVPVDEISESTRIQALCFDNAVDPIVITNYTGDIIDWNDAAQQFFGFSREDALNQSFPQLFGCQSVEEFTKHLTAADGAHRWQGCMSFTHKDGSFGQAEVTFLPLKSELGSLAGQVAFVRKHQPHPVPVPIGPTGPSPEELLQQAKNDNLARVVPQMHQRLRNNLQIIGTLLNLQFKAQRDMDTRDALLAGRNRAFTLSLLHEQIQTKEHEESVDFLQFANQLATQVLESYQAAERVVVDFKIAHTLDLQIASPLALILNELLTNAIKHGFPEPGSGHIQVAISTAGDKGALSIRNDGVVVDHKQLDTTGLGLQVVKTLARQIGGSLEKIDTTETEFRVYFSTALRK